MRRLRPIAPFALVVALPLAARAQDTSATRASWNVDVGSRVRIGLARVEGAEPERVLWSPPLPLKLIGRVVQVTSESLYVQPHPSVGAVAVPRSAARSVAVSGGHPRGRAMTWGAINGAFLGASIGVVAGSPPFANRSVERVFGRDLAMYAASGALTGIILGAIYPGERWRYVR